MKKLIIFSLVLFGFASGVTAASLVNGNGSWRCERLEQMSGEQLIVFFDEVHTENPTGIESCRSLLMQKIDNFINSKRVLLNETYLQYAREHLRRCSNRASATFGPDKVIIPNPAKATVITGSYLPKCDVDFSFDDGPHPVFGPEIVKALQAQDIHANFFQVGQRVAMSPQTTLDEYLAGNVIGTHSWSHPDLARMHPQAAEKQIETAFTEVTDVLHIYTPFFRYPYGAATGGLRAYMAYFGRVTFFWNIDTLDWKIRDPNELYRYAIRQIDQVQRGIILMHEIHLQSVVVLPYLIDALRDAGYQPVVFRSAPEAQVKLAQN